MKTELKSIVAALLAGCLLWTQTVTPSATVNRDTTSGQVTAVVSTSKSNRLVCKFSPLPASPSGPYATLSANCQLNGKPSFPLFMQFTGPYQPGMQAVTLGANANGNMAVTAIFQPVSVVPPGSAPHINYQIAANSVFQQGTF